MTERRTMTVDGNETAASVAHRVSDVIAIYPITPSSSMGELADEWSTQGRRNLWGNIPDVVEMQSEEGAAGAIHGALQTGALSTTFTASQGLLLMIPNMYKIAGEQKPTGVYFLGAAAGRRRAGGWAMLGAAAVQEAQDLALVAHAATLESRIPFLHFFDGFRTSHELQKIETVGDEAIRAMIDERHVEAVRRRGLSPDRPVLRGSAQNPDVFFQN